MRTPEQIHQRLREIAPSIHFSATREIDPSFRWDGDGPDPALDGFAACDVTVTARCITGGGVVEGNDYLGGSYYQDGEPTGDVSGYLPQMLGDAIAELAALLGVAHQYQGELAAAKAFIESESRERYAEQMATA